MKHDRTQWSYFFEDQAVRRNVGSLLKYVFFLLLIVAMYSILFRYLMLEVEGRAYSWISSFYWTLITMSTLGYGDVTFESDVGRLFTIVVLLSGIVTLLVVLPFTFIRFFYAPWLEAQIRRRTPRAVPPDTEGHVVICRYDTMASGVIERLDQENIPYYVIESGLDVAAQQHRAGLSVIQGEVDSKETYEALRVEHARMVLANADDPTNANITLTVREVDSDVPIVAIANKESAVEVLDRSGATRVLPLKRWLGEQLANRVNASRAQAHVVGQYRDLLIAEVPIHHTPLVGKTIRETQLREHTGVSIIGVWERGRLQSARPDMLMTSSSVPIVAGTESQLDELDYLFAIYDVNPHPVLVIGGGAVGLAAARSLKRKEIPVHLIEQDAERCKQLRHACEQAFHGDATDAELLIQAGIEKTPSVIITTSDDALNIFLTSQCRRLNGELRIVSRITHERNIEAIHQAGADFVLGSASLGVEATFSILKGKDIIVLGEGVDLFTLPLPSTLHGKTLAESDIGARTALNVIAVRQNGEIITNPPASTTLHPGAELLLLGDPQQRQRFDELFGEDAIS